MRVLHVIPSLNPRLGGPTRVALQLVRALRRQGVDAEIATIDDVDAAGSAGAVGAQCEFQGVPVRFFPRTWAKREFIVSVELSRWLFEAASSYDLLDLHYLFTFSTTTAARAAVAGKVPYTVRTMGQLAPWSLRQSALRKRIYTFLFERRTLEHASALHCTSTQETEDARRFRVDRPFITLPLGVEPLEHLENPHSRLRAELGISETTPIVLYLSRMHPKKQPDVLIRAIALCKERGFPIHLLLAGTGTASYEGELRELVHRLGVSEQTTFSGHVEGQTKALYLQGSDLFALPSHSENFGIAVAEALDAGLPVVITHGIDIATLVASYEAGIIVDADVESVANSIITLANQPQQRAAYGDAGRRLAAEHFRWDSIASRCASAYSEICNK